MKTLVLHSNDVTFLGQTNSKNTWTWGDKFPDWGPNYARVAPLAKQMAGHNYESNLALLLAYLSMIANFDAIVSLPVSGAEGSQVRLLSFARQYATAHILSRCM